MVSEAVAVGAREAVAVGVRECGRYSLPRCVRGGICWFKGCRGRNLAATAVLVVGVTILHRYFANKRRKKWAAVGKDVVVVHALPKGRLTPNISPFVMKLETYLRLASIPYEVDYVEPLGPKGQCPWVTFNGQELADSQLVIEHLGHHFGKVFEGKLPQEQQAVARALRIMITEHMAWGLRQWRVMQDRGRALQQSMDPLPFIFRLLFPFILRRMKKSLIAQGMGRHTNAEVERMVRQDLAALSAYLGDKRFLMGEDPCEVDCTAFSFISVIMFNYPGSPYVFMLNDDFPNLRKYQQRVQKRLWPDWDDRCLNPSPVTQE